MMVLLLDRGAGLTRYQSRFWTVFSCRNGVYSPMERAQRGGGEMVYFHRDATYEKLAAAMIGATAFRDFGDVAQVDEFLAGNTAPFEQAFSDIVDSANLEPAKVLAGLAQAITSDMTTLAKDGGFAPLGEPGAGVFVVGGRKGREDVLVHESATINPGTIFDTSGGPVIVDAGAVVGQFSFLFGPVYVGRDSHVDNCRLLGPVVIGHNCRVGGEIEESVFGDFSNKHHEGFLGHSMVGRWVNIGALATTSDLKNNYGEVRLSVDKQFLGRAGGDLETVLTGTIKFGSIISDCAKIGILTRLNTGTVIDAGSSVFQPDVGKFVPAFSWGGNGDVRDSDCVYDIERFKKDCRTIFARRQQKPLDNFNALADYVFSQVRGKWIDI